MANETPPIQADKMKGCGFFKGIAEFLDVLNTRNMPVHERKDIFNTILIPIIVIICYYLGIFTRNTAQWFFIIFLAFLFGRLILHSLHYEVKSKRTK